MFFALANFTSFYSNNQSAELLQPNCTNIYPSFIIIPLVTQWNDGLSLWIWIWVNSCRQIQLPSSYAKSPRMCTPPLLDADDTPKKIREMHHQILYHVDPSGFLFLGSNSGIIQGLRVLSQELFGSIRIVAPQKIGQHIPIERVMIHASIFRDDYIFYNDYNVNMIWPLFRKRKKQ